MAKFLCGAACMALLLAAGPARAAWQAEPAPERPGGIETCAVRWPELGVAVMVSRWPDGTVTDIVSVAFANPGNTLELTIDGDKRFVARAGNLRYWSQQELLEALLAGRKLTVAFTDPRGKPARGEMELGSLKPAYQACRAELSAEPAAGKAATQ